MKLKLPENFKMGVATAATQTEGGIVDHNWLALYKNGGIIDNSSPQRANDHFNRVKEDTDLMAEMKLQCFRMGVEWARIEPKQGQFDIDAIQHYIDEICYIQSKGIEVLLTLHHFSNPMWFENLGGWTNKNSAEIFFNFVKNFLPHVAKYINLYITINEPNVYAFGSYLFGQWYPNKKSLGKYGTVLGNLTKAHIDCYEFIHKLREDLGFKDTQVGVANHLRQFEPKNPKNPFHKFCCRFAEKCMQTSITHAMMTGQFKFPVKKQKVKAGKYYDFIGINYYSRSVLSGLKDGVKQGALTNDLGWEIYPEGISAIAKQFYKKYNAPIFVTENGTCDKADAFRAKFIFDHLKELLDSGVPVLRYYHWTFIDNWEWAEGETAPFGLVELNFETQQRTIRQSGKFFTDIIENQGVTEKAYQKYVEKSHVQAETESQD